MKKRISGAALCVILGLVCIVISFLVRKNSVATAVLFFIGIVMLIPSAIVFGVQRRRKMMRNMKDMMTQQIGENMERAAAMGKSTVTSESEEIARQMRENMARARELEKERGK